MRTISILTLFLAAFLFAGCGDNAGFSYSGLNQRLAVTLEGGDTPTVADSGAPEIDGDAEVGDHFDGTEPEPPKAVLDDDGSNNGNDDSEDLDDDNDGINDEEDDLPTVCTKMVVASKGVSSARITLNDEEIFGPSDFHNKNITLEESVNLKSGTNTLSVRLAGSPGDQLLIRIYNCSTDPSTLLYETVVNRTAGQPNTSEGSF